MTDYLVSIQSIEVFHITITAESKEDAIDKAYQMSTLQLAEDGSSQSIETDYAEVIG